MKYIDDWTRVEDGLPEKNGRYQVVMKTGDTYHVTMRKFYADKPHWFTGRKCGWWERCTGGVTHWKPMSDLPAGLKQNEQVLGYYKPRKG